MADDKKVNDGGPAFGEFQPLLQKRVDSVGMEVIGYKRVGGLSKREFFAGMALQGWLSGLGRADREVREASDVYDIAHKAFIFADAMLQEAGKRK